MRTVEELERNGRRKGWVLNTNTKVVEAVLKRQNVRKEKEGEFYCPCKPPALPENICNPCRGAASEISEEGHCHCNLYHDPKFKQKF
jgi:ferredoxin-thioredoxin reductase catalytic subunit